MNLEPVPVEALAPAARKFAGPNVPDAAKMMAARGLAPLAPRDLCSVLAFLAYDEAEAVSVAAKKTLAALPERILDGALRDKQHPAVLHAMARSLVSSARWAELLLLNPLTDDETVHFLTAKCEERQLEIIAQNESRLLRAPYIIEALYMNPKTRMSTVDRVIEFAVRNGLELTGIPAFKEAQAAILGLREPLVVPPPLQSQPPAAAPSAAPSSSVAAGSADWTGPNSQQTSVAQRLATAPNAVVPVMLTPIDTPDSLSAEEVEALASDAPSAEGQTPDEQKAKGSVHALLVKMTASQRVRWAVLGNREVRSFLMRDSNRMVASAAIKNPRVTEQEVITIATSRSVNDEVVRIIGSTREWTKSYQVRLNLVNNPKCPLPTALQFLRTLRQSDVKLLAKNKNVSSAVCAAARRLSNQDK